MLLGLIAMGIDARRNLGRRGLGRGRSGEGGEGERQGEPRAGPGCKEVPRPPVGEGGRSPTG